MRAQWDAERLLAKWGLEMTEEPVDWAECDDPELLRWELEMQRIAAHLERRCREERAVIIQLDKPGEDGSAVACVVTPTGDRAQEADLVRVLVREHLAHQAFTRATLPLVVGLAQKVDDGEIDEAHAWQALLVGLERVLESVQPDETTAEGESPEESE